METNKILNADVLDIIFDGKNKDYGAYQLRKTYNKRLAKSLMYMAGILLITLVGTVLANVIKGAKPQELQVVDTIHFTQFEPHKELLPPPPPPPAMPAPPPQVKMEQFTPPKIVQDIEVKDPPATVEKLETSKIGAISNEGIDDAGIVAPPVESKGTGGVIAPKVQHKDIDDIVTFVQIEARFPGGIDGWKRFLERNLQYPEIAQENGKQAVVKVQLVVDKEGNVSQVKALNDPGDGLAEEAERVIKKGPKWIPAEQNGQKVTYRFVQTITFQLQ